MNKILIIDPVDHVVIEKLKKDFIIDYDIKISREKLINIIKDYSVLIVRSGHRIDKEIINNAKKLKLVIRAGTGFDNIDIETLKNNSIHYCNIPKVNSLAVAELVITYIFALSRDLIYTNKSTKQNVWIKDKYMGYQVENKILGIIGYGSIGQLVAKKANALGMKVLASVKNMNSEKNKIALENNVKLVDNETIYKNSDYISVCVPLNDETKNLISMREFEKMKTSCSFINVSRGLVVNENDLYIALKNNVIRNAGIDVYQNEKNKSKLFELDNIICTPHIGAMTIETQKKIAEIVIKKIYEYKERGIFYD